MIPPLSQVRAPDTPVRDTREESIARIDRLLRQGAPWQAIDVFQAAAGIASEDDELLYWGALAAARAGARHEARRLLDRTRESPTISPTILQDILCLSGRLWKDEADAGADRPLRTEFAEKAQTDYLRAYRLSGDSYPGVNAATLSKLLDDAPTARALASDIVARLDGQGDSLTGWEHAALGESYLLLDRLPEARLSYGRACTAFAGDPGSVGAMRKQLKLLERVSREAATDLLEVLCVPDVLAFAGHMIDAPGQAAQRFPSALEADVAAALREKLAGLHAPVVYTSAACGADLLFIEAALERGAEVNVVLPFHRQDFIRTSVCVGGDGWVERFERALARAHRVVLATEESHLGDDILFEHAFLLIEGLAILRASQFQTSPQLLCVIDPDSRSEPGGTRTAYDRWSRLRGDPATIDLRSLRRSAGLQSDDENARALNRAQGRRPKTTGPVRPQRTLKVLLFADIAGFGRLHDAIAPLFHLRFLRLVADQIARCPTPPLEANTWGDALYVVFDTPDEGAEFALGLIDRMKEVDWARDGLLDSSRIRIALHDGPVFCGFDPIMGRNNYFGSSVTKAARIEPVTPPGLVYVSEAFVATLVSLGHEGFAFEYVGYLELAKGAGKTCIYRLERG